MRPLVKAAMQTSNVVARHARRTQVDTKAAKKRKNDAAKPHADDDGKKKPLYKPLSSPESPPAVDKHVSPPLEFERHSSSAPRRLNDIAQAPPEFKKLPRGAAIVNGGLGSGKREGILSLAQRSMMEKERESAIARYREMRAKQREGRGVTPTEQFEANARYHSANLQ